MTSRFKKAGYTAVVGLGLFAGAAGIAAAASSGGTDPAPEPPAAVTPAADTPEPGDVADEVGGIDCENGIDTATGAECDGGPAAALADEATEAPDDEADEATEGPEDESDDGVDHQFEGEEVGENGNGAPDADDAAESAANG